MKGLFIYVTAGKGHQTPAEALRDAMRDLGHEATSIDLFDLLHDKVTKKYIEITWRNELRHPPIERVSDQVFDTKFNGILMKAAAMCQPYLRYYFKKYMEAEQPDFILGTHCFVNQIIEPYVRAYRLDIPVFGYAPDIFFYPNVGSNPHMDHLYVCSTIGKEWMIGQGFPPDDISICPFPLKHSIETSTIPTQQEARARLGLDDRFTVLMNLGGEGIGNTRLVRRLAKDGIACQFVVVGRMSKSTARKYREFEEAHPSFPIIAPGFTDRMLDYIRACDIQVGKAGANSMMESIYLKRPFIITEQLYPSFRTELFLKQYPLGWVENDPARQAKLIETYATDKNVQKTMAHALETQPMTFSSRKMVEMVIGDAEAYRIRGAGGR